MTDPIGGATPENGERPPQPPTPLIVGVKFREVGQVYDYDAGALPLRRGDRVIVQTERGNTLGTVVAAPRPIPTGDRE
jgi:hypothetical protein